IFKGLGNIAQISFRRVVEEGGELERWGNQRSNREAVFAHGNVIPGLSAEACNVGQSVCDIQNVDVFRPDLTEINQAARIGLEQAGYLHHRLLLSFLRSRRRSINSRLKASSAV